MSESGDTPDATPAASVPATEDDRRQKAAEINRKRTEEQWLRNKQSWIDGNFPDKKKPS